jgi:hypothetical protein
MATLLARFPVSWIQHNESWIIRIAHHTLPGAIPGFDWGDTLRVLRIHDAHTLVFFGVSVEDLIASLVYVQFQVTFYSLSPSPF